MNGYHEDQVGDKLKKSEKYPIIIPWKISQAAGIGVLHAISGAIGA